MKSIIFISSSFVWRKMFLILCMPMVNYSYSQTLLSENNWRAAAYTVDNHTFKVKNRYGGASYGSATNIYSTSCGVHQGSFSLNTNMSATDNDIEIEPESANDYADYINGVSTLDLLAIAQHIASITPFTTGYQKLSADAQEDGDIDQGDLDEIDSLILAQRNDLTRNSWEWMDAEYIAFWSTSFLNNPWNFTLSAVGGIFEQLGLTTPQCTTGVHLGIRTTKVGDIKAISGTSANTWVCGTGSYIKSPQISGVYLKAPQSLEKRSIGEYDKNFVKKGAEITVNVKLSKNEELLSIELPLFIDSKLFKIKTIDFSNGFTPKWHFNNELNRLTMISYDRKCNPIAVSNGDIATIQLIALSTIEDLSSAVKFSDDREVEIINTSLDLANAKVSLEISIVAPLSLTAKLIGISANRTLEINSPNEDFVSIMVMNLNGQILNTRKSILTRGINKIPFTIDFESGIYILNLLTKSDDISIKFIN